jgi:hypothetical protein
MHEVAHHHRTSKFLRFCANRKCGDHESRLDMKDIALSTVLEVNDFSQDDLQRVTCAAVAVDLKRRMPFLCDFLKYHTADTIRSLIMTILKT